eukprot:sb/3470290/
MPRGMERLPRVLAFIKYKQTDSIIAGVLSGIVFFCTIVAIQYWPWSAWLNDSSTGRLSPSKGLIFNFIRLILLTPIVVVYGLWCRKTIEKFWSQWAAVESKTGLDQEGSTTGSFDDVDEADFVNKLIFQIPLVTFYSILLRRKIRKFCVVVGSQGMERVPGSENNKRSQGSPSERRKVEQDDEDEDEFVDEFQNEENLYENYDRRVPN